MKRYRITTFDFDSSVTDLSMEIKPEWEEKTKELHRINKANTVESYKQIFGPNNIDIKIKNAIAIGPSHPTVLAFHNKFLRQIRHSFIVEGYYPALTGACALGERTLNYMIITLKNYYKNSPYYKKISTKESIVDWDKMINILVGWEVLLEEAIQPLKNLKDIRHTKAIHFNPTTDNKDRSYAIEAIKNIEKFIKIQFASISMAPWFIENTKGEFFIKKEWEKNPFVKEIYLPNCKLVGPNHSVNFENGTFSIVDEKYKDIDISDEDFIAMREKFKVGGK